MGLTVVGAQESDQPQATFFAPLNVPLISIEVYVSDRAGRPIPGLTLEDFEIFEDSKPVSISHFFAAPGVTEPVTTYVTNNPQTLHRVENRIKLLSKLSAGHPTALPPDRILMPDPVQLTANRYCETASGQSIPAATS